MDLIGRLWQLLGGDPTALDALQITGEPAGLRSAFDVDGLAVATTAVATLAVAELESARHSTATRPVRIDRRQASAAFVGERLLTPVGWHRPPVWDPIAGDYPGNDGWIRLHTNYPWHRAAALHALGLPDDPELEPNAVAATVRGHQVGELESAVVAAGGCAAAMLGPREWLRHPQWLAVATDPAVELQWPSPDATPQAELAGPREEAPLSGIRVLDLTRVIAGPIATRTLAGWGADVLRIDPPGFPEVPAVLPEVQPGKRAAALDLRQPADRDRFEVLVTQAHVLVHGLRPGALDALGYGSATLRALNPSLVIVIHDAYGWHGPWADRRGFDSLVQMSSGIAAAGAEAAGVDRPVPLPAQALDHGTGYLLAAAACRGLAGLLTGAGPGAARGSLVGTAALLLARPVPDGLSRPEPTWSDADTVLRDSAWGPVRQVPPVGRIGDLRPTWTVAAGPLGRDPASFT